MAGRHAPRVSNARRAASFAEYLAMRTLWVALAWIAVVAPEHTFVR